MSKKKKMFCRKYSDSVDTIIIAPALCGGTLGIHKETPTNIVLRFSSRHSFRLTDCLAKLSIGLRKLDLDVFYLLLWHECEQCY